MISRTEAVDSPTGAGRPRETLSIALRVKGSERQFDVEPRVTLLHAPRDGFDLTGTKKGCDHEQCGACLAGTRQQ